MYYQGQAIVSDSIKIVYLVEKSGRIHDLLIFLLFRGKITFVSCAQMYMVGADNHIWNGRNRYIVLRRA